MYQNYPLALSLTSAVSKCIGHMKMQYSSCGQAQKQKKKIIWISVQIWINHIPELRF